MFSVYLFIFNINNRIVAPPLFRGIIQIPARFVRIVRISVDATLMDFTRMSQICKLRLQRQREFCHQAAT